MTSGHIKVLYNPLHLEWHVTMQSISRMVKTAHEKQGLFESCSAIFMQIGKEVIIKVTVYQGNNFVGANI